MRDKKSKLRERAFTVFFMFATTFVFFSATYALHLTSLDKIRANEAVALERSVIVAAGIDAPADSAAIRALFAKRVRPVAGRDGAVEFYTVHPDRASDVADGYVFAITGRGLWGALEAVVGFDAGLRSLTGIDFTKHNETPGLGARITEAWFVRQFAGKIGPLKTVPEGAGGGPREFDAITGATHTINGVREMLNRAFAELPDKIGKR